jgi:hypothetical protein
LEISIQIYMRAPVQHKREIHMSGIFAGHVQNPLGDRFPNARPPASLPSVGSIASNEIAIPGEERIQCHQVGDFVEHFSSERVCFGGQASPIAVRPIESKTLELLFALNRHPNLIKKPTVAARSAPLSETLRIIKAEPCTPLPN